MQKLSSIHTAQAMVDAWDDALTKEAAIPGAGLLRRIVSKPAESLQAVSGPAGRLLSKLPGVGNIKTHLADPAVRQAWKGRGAVGAAGAGLGAAHGAATAEEGQRGAGALRGAILGGGAGVAAGQFATRAGRAQVGRVAQRQAHSVTGYMPRTEAQVRRGVSRFGGKGWTGADRKAAFQQMMGGKELDPGLAAAAERGLTSIPGIARGLATKGQRVENLRRAVMSQGWQAPALTAALTVPAAVGAVKSGDPAALGETIGTNVGYLVGSPLPFVGNVVAGEALGGVGKKIGKGIGRLTGRTPRSE